MAIRLSEPTTGRAGDAYLKRKDALWAIYLAKVPSVGGVPTNLFNIPDRGADVRKRPMLRIKHQSDSKQVTDLTSGHKLYLPLLHCPQAQQLCPGSIDTLSPTCTFLTSLPTAMTTPLDSWPSTMSLSTT